MRRTAWLVPVLTWAVLTIAPASDACTSFVVSKGASVDGSTMITYAADSHELYGELYYTPAAKHAPGSKREIRDWDSLKTIGSIDQVAETYRVVGNMNEHQVVIGETTFGGHKGLHDPKGGIDYGSMIYVALERAKTAREAIKVMTSLANEYCGRSRQKKYQRRQKSLGPKRHRQRNNPTYSRCRMTWVSQMSVKTKKIGSSTPARSSLARKAVMATGISFLKTARFGRM